MGKVAVGQKKGEAQSKKQTTVRAAADKMVDDIIKNIQVKLPLARMSRNRSESYKVEEVLRVGKSAFLDRVSPRAPLQIPDLGFTEEEKRLMDEVITESAGK